MGKEIVNKSLRTFSLFVSLGKISDRITYETKSITYSECLSVALVQHAILLRDIIFSSVASLVLPYFFHITT